MRQSAFCQKLKRPHTNVFIVTFVKFNGWKCYNLCLFVCLFVCFQLFEEIPLQSGVQQNEDIATWFLLEVFKDNQCRQFWRHSK